jgi:hypothetical protein
VSSAWMVCRTRLKGLLVPSLVLAGIFGCSAELGWAQLGASTLGANSATGDSAATGSVPSTVSGQVINASTGGPVSRALVRLNGRAVLTDHEGKFRFEQNTESSANVLVSKPGYYASTEMQEPGNVFLQGDQLGTPLTLRLYPEGLLTGRVTAPDGTPLSRIMVYALRSVYDENGHRWANVERRATDSHGDFRLTVPPGNYRLETQYTPLDRTMGEAILPVTVPGEGSTDASQTISIHSGEEQHFELQPGMSAVHDVGAMIEPPGRDFLRITARSSNGRTMQVNPQTNSETGEVKIQLPQGAYTLTARRGTGDSPEEADTTVTVPDHDISGVVFRFSPIPSIPVEMIVDGAGTSDNAQLPTLSQLGLVLQSDQQDADRGEANVRPTLRRDQSNVFVAPPGTYRLQGRNTGVWFIKAANYGDSDLLQDSLVVVPGAAGTPIRVTVSDQTGALQGTVDLNGGPAACWIYLIPTTPSAQSVLTVRSSSSGSYTLAHLPPGGYQAIAFEQRHSANYRDAASLAPYASYVHSVTVNAGDKPTLNLDAVPVAEVVP